MAKLQLLNAAREFAGPVARLAVYIELDLGQANEREQT